MNPWIVGAIGLVLLLAWNGQRGAVAAPFLVTAPPLPASAIPVNPISNPPQVVHVPVTSVPAPAPVPSVPVGVVPGNPAQTSINKQAVQTLQTGIQQSLGMAIAAEKSTGAYAGLGVPEAPGQPSATFGGSVPGPIAPLGSTSEGTLDTSGLNLGENDPPPITNMPSDVAAPVDLTGLGLSGLDLSASEDTDFLGGFSSGGLSFGGPLAG